jgi:hypothetical protein
MLWWRVCVHVCALYVCFAALLGAMLWRSSSDLHGEALC